MPELLLVAGLLVIAGYAWIVQRVVSQRHHDAVTASVTRMPPGLDDDYLSAAREHYRRLAKWARLLEDLRRDDLVWPLLPKSTKTLIERELEEFYRL